MQSARSVVIERRHEVFLNVLCVLLGGAIGPIEVTLEPRRRGVFALRLNFAADIFDLAKLSILPTHGLR